MKLCNGSFRYNAYLLWNYCVYLNHTQKSLCSLSLRKHMLSVLMGLSRDRVSAQYNFCHIILTIFTTCWMKWNFQGHKYVGLEFLCPMDRTAGLLLQLPPNMSTCSYLSMVQKGQECSQMLWRGRQSHLVGGRHERWSYLEGALGKWGTSEGYEKKKLWKCLLRVGPDCSFLEWFQSFLGRSWALVC